MCRWKHLFTLIFKTDPLDEYEAEAGPNKTLALVQERFILDRYFIQLHILPIHFQNLKIHEMKRFHWQMASTTRELKRIKVGRYLQLDTFIKCYFVSC